MSSLPDSPTEPLDDGSKHFTRLVAPFLAGFCLPTIGGLVANTAQPPQPWRDVALSLFVAAAGLLLAGFQLSIGSLFTNNPRSLVRPILAFAGLGSLTLGVTVLLLSASGVTQPLLIWLALLVLLLGVFVPIAMRIKANPEAPDLLRRWRRR
jgi:hypothetical protein